MDTVEDIMTKKVVTCDPTTNILEVRDLIGRHRINRVVVVDEKNRPIGILTYKDVVNFLISNKSSQSLEEIPTEEVMCKDLITIKLNESISKASETMINKNISSLIVLDEEGDLKGILTKADLSSYLASKGVRNRVLEFMTPNPVTVMSSHSIFLVTHLMNEKKISRVVVIDHENKPIGIITLADVAMISSLIRPPKRLLDERLILTGGTITLPRGVHLLTAGDVMTVNPISIEKDAGLSDAARMMVRKGISGLPVVDNSGKLEGIITKSDITRAVASLKEEV